MPSRPQRALLLLVASVLTAVVARAGGDGENAVLVVDPANPESLYVANYYRAARDVPPINFVYIEPGASDYQEFANVNLEGFFGTLANHRIFDHADYVLVPSGGSFYIDAPNLVSDSCFQVKRLGIASGYTLAWMADKILGGLPSGTTNHFAETSWDARFFDSSYPWFVGAPSASGQKYFIGAMLGYTGANGNTLQEVLDMIDRSVAVDGTHPAGTFYFVETPDDIRSNPRDHAYAQAVVEMAAAGGVAQHIFDWLPYGQHDGLGVMTGFASIDVEGADMTILDGAFGDHLTSFAGKFDTSSQTKMSEWIRKGCSGTSGTVEEPCNYSQKFPHARLHVLYRKGMALGESWFRSMDWAPFQNLLYGDPLTSPWANRPGVDVPNPPVGAVAGIVTLSPVAIPTEPGAVVDELRLLVDGVLTATIADGESFALDTLLLADGWHELRIVAFDDAPERNTGRWIGSVTVDNHGRSVSLGATPTTGDLAQRFDLAVDAAGGTLKEIRVLQNGRVVAATGTAPAMLEVHGQNLGAGPVLLQAEAVFDDLVTARSAPLQLDVDFVAGTPSGAAPFSYAFAKTVFDDASFVLELPASYGDDLGTATYTVVQHPAQATLVSSGSGPYRIYTPDPSALGLDSLTFRVDTPGGTSAEATVVIEYVEGITIPDGDFFELTEVIPSQIEALIPGSGKTIELHGEGFGPATQVLIDGVPAGGILPAWSFVDETLIKLDMPQVDHLGAITVTVQDGIYQDSVVAEIVVPAAPVLQLGTGGSPSIVIQSQGIDVTVSGVPGSSHIVGVSLSNQPSSIPGVVDLLIGGDFTSLFEIGTFTIDPVQAWTQVHFPLGGLAPGTTFYGQSVDLTLPVPLATSNLQEVLILF
ncbi:MAG: hypothetical protein O7B99_00235 [Planctomycetota bacterium]|nr:hypothetical protein [Planctomycetota bacterium]